MVIKKKTNVKKTSSKKASKTPSKARVTKNALREGKAKKHGHHNLNDLFLDELADMYNSEKQIVKALPNLVKAASLPDLKNALRNHLAETKNQVKRIEQIFTILKIKRREVVCDAMKGIIKECGELTKNKSKSATTDAAIISASQKVEHYEIASYGSLRSFAKNLGLDSKIADLINASLQEEGAADHKLTKIADGNLFKDGVNKKAVEGKKSK